LKNIVLIGPSGSGKTSCATFIASTGSHVMVDSDELITKSTGLTPEQIFSQHGEPVFRQLESELLREIQKSLSEQSIVLSTGGGLPITAGNFEVLESIGHIVYLKANPEILAKRVQDGPARPMLNQTDNPSDTLTTRIETLITLREPVYKRANDIIDTTRHTIEEVSRLILTCIA
jgi:shikimate kinase